MPKSRHGFADTGTRRLKPVTMAVGVPGRTSLVEEFDAGGFDRAPDLTRPLDRYGALTLRHLGKFEDRVRDTRFLGELRTLEREKRARFTDLFAGEHAVDAFELEILATGVQRHADAVT